MISITHEKAKLLNFDKVIYCLHRKKKKQFNRFYLSVYINLYSVNSDFFEWFISIGYKVIE